MSKSHCLHHKSLHSLPKFASKTQRIQVGNGHFISVLFLIPVIVDVHRHRFEIYILVSEIHENVYVVLGIKNMFELEGTVNSSDCCFSFLNRSIPFFPKECILKLEEPFIDEISGITITKILDKNVQNTMMLKLKFMQNLAI